VKVGTGERTEKPIFGPVSKNNTGMAALSAGLPVTTTTTIFYSPMCRIENTKTCSKEAQRQVARKAKMLI